jgi:hypothetical protein
MANPMRSTDFRSVVEPILNEVFDGVYDQRADEWKQVAKERQGIKRAYHEEPVLYGFNAAPEVPDGDPVTYGQGGELFRQRYIYRVFGLAFALTRILVEDGDHISIGKIYTRHLSQSMIETKETLVAQIFNRAFNGSFPGGDGVCMNNASHPIANGTFSNLLTTAAALSQTSAEQMLIQIRGAVDNNGKKVRLNPVQFIVSPSNMFQAEVIIRSVLRTGGANNDINPIVSMKLLSKGVAVLSRVTSTTAWWIQNGNIDCGVQLMMRRGLQKAMEGDFETDSMRYKSTERYIPGWTDPRDNWGTAGL